MGNFSPPCPSPTTAVAGEGTGIKSVFMFFKIYDFLKFNSLVII